MADPKNPTLGMPQKTHTGMAEKAPAAPFEPVVSHALGGVVNQPSHHPNPAGDRAAEQIKMGDAIQDKAEGTPKPAGALPALPAAEQKAKLDFDALQAKAKEDAAATQKVATERKVKVKLLNDVWIEDPTHEDAGKDGIRRVKTNIPVLDEQGNPKVDPKSKAPITTHALVELPLSVAKAMIDAGKAERQDPL